MAAAAGAAGFPQRSCVQYTFRQHRYNSFTTLRLRLTNEVECGDCVSCQFGAATTLRLRRHRAAAASAEGLTQLDLEKL